LNIFTFINQVSLEYFLMYRNKDKEKEEKDSQKEEGGEFFVRFENICSMSLET